VDGKSAETGQLENSGGAKNGLGYSRYLAAIEYLRYSFGLKKDGATRHPQIFNWQFSIPACPG